MSMKVKESSVVFSTRGQVVIPRYIRKAFGIEEGTRAIVESADDGSIILRPVTAEAIRRGFGIFKKRESGGRSVSEWRTEHKKQEIALEEAKLERCKRA